MPDVFISMVTPSDSKVMEDLYIAVRMEHDKVERDKRKPVPQQFLYNFLSNRVTSDKIDRIIITAEKNGLLIKSTGGFNNSFIPAPRNYRNGEDKGG
jgi:hypothetical protein